jgi:AraC-like DNA-binding protein
MTLRAASVGPITVGLLDYGTEVRIDTDDLVTGYEVNLPLAGMIDTWTGEERVHAGGRTGAVYRPYGRTSIRGWAGGGPLLGVKIARRALESALIDLVDSPVDAPVALGSRLDVGEGTGRQWWQLAGTMAELIRDPTGLLAQPMVARPLAESLVHGLLYAVDHPYRAELAAPRPAARPSMVGRAVELIETDPAEPHTVAGIAARTGCSVRALQEGFRRHLGMPPMSYLRRVRLQRAHADLCRADPATSGVAEIAGRWGFTHLGRFAAQYRARYGVSPSHSLRSRS